MSRSKPTEGARNPSVRWFEWAGGKDGGFVRYYDKDSKTNIRVDGVFAFLLLDELSTVKGWHDASESGIYANEVHVLQRDVLTVRAFKGGDLVAGLYADIKDRVRALGGHYCVSIYLAFKDGQQLKIGNLSLKGAAAGAWMEFKKAAPAKQDENGKSVRGYFVDAVKITGYKELKKGATVYRVPEFGLVATSAETNAQAMVLDIELQEYLTGYARQDKPPVAEPAMSPPEPTDDGFQEDDIPFN